MRPDRAIRCEPQLAAGAAKAETDLDIPTRDQAAPNAVIQILPGCPTGLDQCSPTNYYPGPHQESCWTRPRSVVLGGETPAVALEEGSGGRSPVRHDTAARRGGAGVR